MRFSSSMPSVKTRCAKESLFSDSPLSSSSSGSSRIASIESSLSSPRPKKAFLPLDQIILGECVTELEKFPPKSFDLVFADPPYNLQLQTGLMRPNHTLVQGVEEEWDKFTNFKAYDSFTESWLRAVQRVMKPQATLFVIGSYHNIFRVGTLLQDLGFWILNDIIWRKTNPMPNFRGRRFTNAHETLIWATKSTAGKRYTFNYASLKAGNEDFQMRSDDWTMPVCNGKERLKDSEGHKIHPTQKPESLLMRIILSASNPGDVLLDPFSGTGTTGAVAKRLGRHFIGIEKEEAYVKVARARIAKVHAWSAETCSPLLSERKAPKISFGRLVEAGLILPGTLVYDLQRRHQALVRADGTLASGAFVGSIHKIGALVQDAPACNGWLFWHRERRGRLEEINCLRQEMRRRMAEEIEIETDP